MEDVERFTAMSALHELINLTRAASQDAVRDFFAPLRWLEIKKAFRRPNLTERTAVLHSDAPIFEEKDDLLNRRPFARLVAEGLKTTPTATGFVVSLEAPWGYGKTSLLNLIEKAVRRWPPELQPIILKFNPWLVGGAETLIQSFLIQLAIAIEESQREPEGEKQAAQKLFDYSTLFTVFKFVTKAAPWVAIAKEAISFKAPAKSLALSDLDLQRHKSAVVSALLRIDRQILVFIDDLDRLPPREVFEMIRLVKSVGDFPGLTYILCFDFAYVANALREYKINDPETYLDKVVQSRLELPSIDRDDLLNIFNTEYDSLDEAARKEWFSNQQERLSEVYYFGLRRIFTTPRDIKRLFNRLRFVEPGCRGEVNIADLMGLESLALKAPAVYAHIKLQPEAYVGRSLDTRLELRSREDLIKAYADEREEALRQARPQLRETVETLVELLFPLVKERAVRDISDARSRGLIAAPDRLAIALSAGLPSREVPYAIATEFAKNAAKRRAILDELLETRKLDRFVEHLNDVVKHVPVQNSASFAILLGATLDSPIGLELESSRQDIFEFSLSRKIWAVIRQLLEKQKQSPDSRGALLREIVANGQLTVATDAVSLIQAQHGAFKDERSLPKEERWLTETELESLTEIWAERISSALADRSLLQKAGANSILFRIKRFRPDVLKQAFEHYFSDIDAFDRLIELFAQRGTDTTGGDYAKFSPEDFDVIGPEALVRERAMQRLADGNLDPRRRNAYQALLSGRKIYFKSGEMADDDE
jgi:hypothetical protein